MYISYTKSVYQFFFAENDPVDLTIVQPVFEEF